MVSDGTRLSQWEARELQVQPLQTRDLHQMIRVLNNARKNNRLYVRLLGRDQGAVVKGESLSSLPPSVHGGARVRPQRRELQAAAERRARANGTSPPSTPSTARARCRCRSRNDPECAILRRGFPSRCSLSASRRAAGHAALPTFWQVSTEAEFLQGDVENLSIDPYGRLTLGPAVTRSTNRARHFCGVW